MHKYQHDNNLYLGYGYITYIFKTYFHTIPCSIYIFNISKLKLKIKVYTFSEENQRNLRERAQRNLKPPIILSSGDKTVSILQIYLHAIFIKLFLKSGALLNSQKQMLCVSYLA